VEEYIRKFQPDLRFRSTLPTLSRKVKVEQTWKPYHILWQDYEWLSLLMEEDKIIGFYRGETYEDDLGRRYSKISDQWSLI
ncbi:Acyl-CoA N-acetyltransferase, partial [Cedratvirus Zaza IHUMI]